MKYLKHHKVSPKLFEQLIRLPLPFTNGGFTLIEILVVVLIIGILGAIALPQYQRAVLKSRFAALMPIAKSMADSNEAFYLEHGEYADNAEDLPIQGRRNYSDGTELEFGTTSEYSYVLATRDNDFPNNYIVYQKHSEQFPGEIHCEADSNNTLAQEVCQSFGATQDIGETLTSGYLTYVLFGTGNGVAPSGDEPGNDEPGDNPSTTNSESELTPEELAKWQAAQDMADLKCANPSYGCVGIPNEDGTISVCENFSGTVKDNAVCDSNGNTSDRYEAVYDNTGKMVATYWCSVESGSCYLRTQNLYSADGSHSTKRRQCINNESISTDFTCPSGKYSSTNSSDQINNSLNNLISHYVCLDNSDCSTYQSMQEWNEDRSKTRTCKTGKIDKHTCTEWNNWK